MGRNQITYQWVAEETDPGVGDIENVTLFDTRAEAEATTSITGLPVVVALLRIEGNQTDGEIRRYYAYPLDDGSMPERFSSTHREFDGPEVPTRFRIVEQSK